MLTGFLSVIRQYNDIPELIPRILHEFIEKIIIHAVTDPIYIYDINNSRSTNDLKELLNDYKGYLVYDGYTGYNFLTKQGINLQRCMVHARRYFSDVLKVLNKDEQTKLPAYKAINLMSILFRYETYFKKKSLTASEIVKYRNSNTYLKAIEKLDYYIDSIDITNNQLLSKYLYLAVKKDSMRIKILMSLLL